MQHNIQNQNQTETDSSDKFFLPSFANRRSSRNIGTANLATAGLFSALAACGGDSDGDGLATFTIDSLGDAFDETAARTSQKSLSEGIVDSMSTLTFATSEDAAKEFKLSVESPGVVKLNHDNGTASNTLDDTALSVSIAGTHSHGLDLLDIEIDGNDKDELALVWYKPNQSIIIIWDFAEQITGNNKALSYSNNMLTDGTSSSGANVNLSLNRLHIFRDFQTWGFLERPTIAKIGDKAAVLLSDHGYKHNGQTNTGIIYLVWDVAQYKNTVATVSLSPDGQANALAISGAVERQRVGKNLDDYKFPLPKIDNDDKKELYVSAIVDKTGLPGWFYVIWDIADYATGGSKDATHKIVLNDSASLTTGALSIFSSEKRFGLTREFADLDGDGMKDIILGSKTGNVSTSPDRKVYIIWADAVTDDTGQGREGVIKLSQKTTGGNIEAFTNNGFTQDGATFANAGLQIGVPDQTLITTDSDYVDYLEEIANNFRFFNIDSDGIKDAVAYRANADGTYNWWKMTAGENVLSGDGSAASPYTFAGTANPVASKTVDELIEISDTFAYHGYAKQKVNNDDYADLVARESEGGLHKVWLGTAAGTFDVTSAHDVYAKVASSSSSALEDSAADFQLVDIA